MMIFRPPCRFEQVKNKSAVSAAFELCVAMDPKTRPKFELKDNGKTKTAVRGPAAPSASRDLSWHSRGRQGGLEEVSCAAIVLSRLIRSIHGMGTVGL